MKKFDPGQLSNFTGAERYFRITVFAGFQRMTLRTRPQGESRFHAGFRKVV